MLGPEHVTKEPVSNRRPTMGMVMSECWWGTTLVVRPPLHVRAVCTRVRGHPCVGTSG